MKEERINRAQSLTDGLEEEKANRIADFQKIKKDKEDQAVAWIAFLGGIIAEDDGASNNVSSDLLPQPGGSIAAAASRGSNGRLGR